MSGSNAKAPKNRETDVDQVGIAVLTDDATFDDAHEATDALSEAFSELRCAAGL
jgi:diacylglycerol O-acyltransferase